MPVPGGEKSLDILVAFGRAVKARRAEVNLSQEALANKAGVARSFISGVERGANRASVTSVWKIAQALDCQPSDIWTIAERIYYSGAQGATE